MPEWKPGVLAELLTEIGAAGRASQRAGLLKIALAVEAKAKDELGKQSHRYGTPTPAGRGQPPALVTGTGRRSIGHEYIADLVEPMVRVGTIANVFPPAVRSSTGSGSRSRASAGTTGTRGKTASSKYLLYQETLLDHAFLKPSLDAVIAEDAVRIWLESFTKWPRLL